MTSKIATLAAALLAWAALPAAAMYPESGWYWNAAESGRGFNLEIQDNLLFMAAFVYRADGSPAWYVAGGAMTDDRHFTADLFETSNGQCLGCAWRASTATKIGTATITFTSERAATITLPNATISVVRQDWSGYGTNSRDAMMGEWSSTEGDPAAPVYSGDRISLHIPQTDAAGPFVSGYRTGATSNIAVGEWNPTLGAFSIVLDSSTGFYKLYVFTLNAFNRGEGAVWTYAKTAAPTGPGTYYVAHRTKSATFLRTGSGPAIFKSTERSALRDALDASAAEEASAAAAPAGVVEAARRLQSLLEGR